MLHALPSPTNPLRNTLFLVLHQPRYFFLLSRTGVSAVDRDLNRYRMNFYTQKTIAAVICQRSPNVPYLTDNDFTELREGAGENKFVVKDIDRCIISAISSAFAGISYHAKLPQGGCNRASISCIV